MARKLCSDLSHIINARFRLKVEEGGPSLSNDVLIHMQDKAVVTSKPLQIGSVTVHSCRLL